jgi:hypothetical protein
LVFFTHVAWVEITLLKTYFMQRREKMAYHFHQSYRYFSSNLGKRSLISLFSKTGCKSHVKLSYCWLVNQVKPPLLNFCSLCHSCFLSSGCRQHPENIIKQLFKITHYMTVINFHVPLMYHFHWQNKYWIYVSEFVWFKWSYATFSKMNSSVVLLNIMTFSLVIGQVRREVKFPI